MLVLTRKPGESVVIGNDIRVTVVNIRGNKVRLAFDAPDDVTIHREEIYEIQRRMRAPDPPGKPVALSCAVPLR